VLELEDITISVAGRTLLDDVTWLIGPGDRIGMVGINGAGKTTLLKLLADEPGGDITGKITRGKTIKVGHLSQELTELDPAQRVRESVEEIKLRIQVGKRELSAGQLLERLGFFGDRQWTPIGDLSGGERRRLQMLRLLMAEPNVLLLDEPTNDLDIEMLTEFEDILDDWPGTLVVVSHDRYFLERATDRVVALLGDGKVSFLGGGVDEYLRRSRARRAAIAAAPAAPAPAAPSAGGAPVAAAGGSSTATATRSQGELRAVRKEMQRLERQIEKAAQREDTIHEQLAANATDYEKLTDLGTQLSAVQTEKADLEERWLEVAGVLEG
jgi:ATP-binding cassette subfamily F protein uup